MPDQQASSGRWRRAGAAKGGGAWPFTHFNRTHVAPPLVISEGDLVRGIAVLEGAITVADGYAA